MILLAIALGVWLLAMAMIVGLCRAAAAGDRVQIIPATKLACSPRTHVRRGRASHGRLRVVH
jgi:hypothetical protein